MFLVSVGHWMDFYDAENSSFHTCGFTHSVGTLPWITHWICCTRALDNRIWLSSVASHSDGVQITFGCSISLRDRPAVTSSKSSAIAAICPEFSASRRSDSEHELGSPKQIRRAPRLSLRKQSTVRRLFVLSVFIWKQSRSALAHSSSSGTWVPNSDKLSLVIDLHTFKWSFVAVKVVKVGKTIGVETAVVGPDVLVIGVVVVEVAVAVALVGMLMVAVFTCPLEDVGDETAFTVSWLYNMRTPSGKMRFAISKQIWKLPINATDLPNNSMPRAASRSQMPVLSLTQLWTIGRANANSNKHMYSAIATIW